MSGMVLDAGNSIIKAKIARREQGEIAFPHAIRQLSESEYEKIFSRAQINGNSKDYFRVNGKPYAIGESAERHGVVIPRSGTARYTEDYCGVLAAVSLARFYERCREVSVFASHPPGDVKYREDLMKAIIGDWEVEIGHSKAKFRVTYVNTFDEPVGGLMNVLLTEDGQHYQFPQIGDGRSLVVDIGGFTTDFLAVKQGGEVDYALARSVPLGIQSIIRDFEESFRTNNLEIVKDTPVLPPDRVRKAISTGIFVGGGQKYPCEKDVEEATSLFLNRFADTYQRLAGGALSWDNIILTGGGSALLHHKLVPILKHNNIILAELQRVPAPGECSGRLEALAVVRDSECVMSEVISFRLNPDNPREAQALEILRAKQTEGYSSRRVMTDALIGMATEKRQFPIDEFNTTLEHISELLERLNDENHVSCQSTHRQQQVASLNDNFLKSVKVAAKPGLSL